MNSRLPLFPQSSKNYSHSQIGQWWIGFIINFRWSRWVQYLDNWTARSAALIPFVGYAILFNDQVADAIKFETISGTSSFEWSISTESRLRFIYFGLVILGASNFIYRLRRPHTFILASDPLQYADYGIARFPLSYFIDMHHDNRREGHASLQGKYYDSEWDGFRTAATNKDEGRETVERTGNWEEAKRAYGTLLRSILIDNFERYNATRRVSLAINILLATVAYILLAIPSIDLFLRVCLAAMN